MKRTAMCSFLLAALLVAQAAAADVYHDIVASARQLIEENKPAEAARKCEEAITANPNLPEAYFYAGLACYKQDDMNGAEQNAKLALAHGADDEMRVQIDKLEKVIQKKRGFLEKVKEADAAYDQGLLARAAEGYRSAFALFPQQSEVGLKAARLYASSLDAPLEAAALCHRIMGSEGTAAVRQANELLAQIDPALQARYNSLLQSTRTQPNQTIAGARANFTLLAEAFPDRSVPQFELARCYAQQGDTEAAKKHLAEANKLGGIQIEMVFNDRSFESLRQRFEFQQFLRDVFGTGGFERANGRELARLNEEREARHKVEEAERAKQQRQQEDLEERNRDLHRLVGSWVPDAPTGGKLLKSEGGLEIRWQNGQPVIGGNFMCRYKKEIGGTYEIHCKAISLSTNVDNFEIDNQLLHWKDNPSSRPRREWGRYGVMLLNCEFTYSSNSNSKTQTKQIVVQPNGDKDLRLALYFVSRSNSGYWNEHYYLKQKQ